MRCNLYIDDTNRREITATCSLRLMVATTEMESIDWREVVVASSLRLTIATTTIEMESMDRREIVAITASA